VKRLLEPGVDINDRNAIDETPLDSAAAKGNVEVVQLIIERGAEVDSRDMLGYVAQIYMQLMTWVKHHTK
jgi:ankyrin repeat protein